MLNATFLFAILPSSMDINGLQFLAKPNGGQGVRQTLLNILKQQRVQYPQWSLFGPSELNLENVAAASHGKTDPDMSRRSPAQLGIPDPKWLKGHVPVVNPSRRGMMR